MDEKGYRAEARPLSAGDVRVGSEMTPHTLEIMNREQVTIQGVISVDSFDTEEIILETEMGTLTLRGEDLHIKQLDLESGRFAVEGFVLGCNYSAPRQRAGRPSKSKGLLERLLR